ncbi:hypothetical protein [Kitasatospora herbaricolor]|uniref:Uncharacterized protein n=1 Tax=Kitasatospora herbaricolor TaxID=68217 RepID=A0ABZ1WGU0_9ACTN|nr:hypothetical protein [Kitasatospora herbaricolor]
MPGSPAVALNVSVVSVSAAAHCRRTSSSAQEAGVENLVPGAPETARDGQAALVEAITEAVRGGDDRTIGRLLARFAEPASIADLYALRDSLDTARPSGPHRQG